MKTNSILNNQEQGAINNNNTNNTIDNNNKSLFDNDEKNSIMDHNNSTDSSMTEVKNEMNFDEKIADQSIDDLYF